jgi:hypothetical protein
MCNRDSFPGLGEKLTTHLKLNADFKKAWVYISTPPYAFMA